MCKFLDALAPYIDKDNLLAPRPNPTTPGEAGNPLVLAGVAAAIARAQDDFDPSHETITHLACGVSRLEGGRGIPNHKANSSDQTTHDDVIGLVAFSKILIAGYHIRLAAAGRAKNWILSNTGEFYWDAVARPWDIAFYKIAVGLGPSLFQEMTFRFRMAAFRLWPHSYDASGAQLEFLRCRALGISCPDVSRFLSQYHGENHPFSIFYK